MADGTENTFLEQDNDVLSSKVTEQINSNNNSSDYHNNSVKWSDKNIQQEIHKISEALKNESTSIPDFHMDKIEHIGNVIFFNNSTVNDGMNFGGHNLSEVKKNTGDVDKKYDLADPVQFAKFGETVQGSEYFAVAVILCIFEYVTLDNLQELKSKLIDEFPTILNDDGERIAIPQNPFLSIDNILKTIGGKMFLSDSGENCIGLGGNRIAALKNLWQQFPAIRSFIARWMINVSNTFKYRTSFDTAQIASAFVSIFKLDFNAAVIHFYNRFVSDPSKYWLLGIIGANLYRDPNYHDKIMPYIIQWASSSSDWMWKSSLYIYANISEGEEDVILDKMVKTTLKKRFDNFENDEYIDDNLLYIANLMMGSERLRTLIASIFFQLMQKTSSYFRKRCLCLWYLQIMHNCYYFVSSEYVVLPLVVCDKNQQLQEIMPVVNIILSKYDTKQILFMILESYFNKIFKYDVSQKIINALKAFFQLMVENNPNFCGDIILFLEKCNSKITKEILTHFYKEMRRSTTVLLHNTKLK